MLDKQVLNHRQIAWLVGSVLMTGMMISFMQTLIAVAKMDAWFSQVLPVCYAIVIAYVLAELARAYPGKNIFEILFIACGRWLGGVINLILLFYIWMIVAVDIKGAADFFHATLLPQTPLEIIVLVFSLLLMYYGKTSLEVAARVNEIYFPFNVVTPPLMYFLLSNEYSLERLEPILSTSLKHIFVSNFMSLGVYGDILLFGAFLHATSNPRLLFAAMKHGILIVGFSATMILVIMLGVMGFAIASRLNYPIFILVQQIHITDFMDRVEIALFSLWFPAFTIKVIVGYFAFMVGIAAFGGQRQLRTYNAPCGWFMVVSSLLIFPQTEDLDLFISYTLTVIVLAIQLPLLLILYIRARMTRKSDSQEGIPKGTRLYRFYRMTVWVGALAILGSALAIVIGDLIGSKSTWTGIISAATFIGFFFVALLASYGEMQALNHAKQKIGKAKEPGAFRQ